MLSSSRTVRATPLRQSFDFLMAQQNHTSTGTSAYRCPGCGEIVSGRDMNEIQLHHDHVLHPESLACFHPARHDDAQLQASSRG
jgi:hypothetical protein